MTRAGWTRSQESLNHHRLVWVLKHPDSSVTRTGRQDEPLPPAACPWVWIRILGEILFPSPKSLSGGESIAKVQHRIQHQPSFFCRRAVNLNTRRQPAKKTSISTPVGKEGSHRLEKRVYWCFHSWGNSGPGCPLLVLCAFVFACLSVMYCYYRVIIFQGAEENFGGEKKTNEERNRRASIFLLINSSKMAKINKS